MEPVALRFLAQGYQVFVLHYSVNTRFPQSVLNLATAMYTQDKTLYPFGYGLSYTSFAYANLRLSSDLLRGNEAITMSVDVTNTGERSDDEVVPLYVKHLNSTVERPLQELKGFRRICLLPVETQTVTLSLATRDLACWDTGEQRFVVEDDTIQIRIGRSSADIHLKATANVVG